MKCVEPVESLHGMKRIGAVMRPIDRMLHVSTSPTRAYARPAGLVLGPTARRGLAAMTDDGRAEGGRAPQGDDSSADLRLVARLRARDEAAFSGLVDALSPSLLRLGRLYASSAGAEEVVQDTWLAVVRGLDAFEGRSSLRAWIFGILVNVARTRRRHDRRQIPFAAFEETETAARPTVSASRFRPAGDEWEGHWVSYPRRWEEQPEAAWLSKEATAVIRRTIDGLPPAQREVVTMRDVLGWSAGEVAEALGISAGNQRVLLHRGRSRVRNALDRFALGSRARSVSARPVAGRRR